MHNLFRNKLSKNKRKEKKYIPGTRDTSVSRAPAAISCPCSAVPTNAQTMVNHHLGPFICDATVLQPIGGLVVYWNGPGIGDRGKNERNKPEEGGTNPT